MSKSNRDQIFGQSKDIDGKLGVQTVREVIDDFKARYDNHQSTTVGFELIGGDGMTKPAAREWNKFEDWCEKEQLQCDYSTREETESIRDELINRTANKHKNKS